MALVYTEVSSIPEQGQWAAMPKAAMIQRYGTALLFVAASLIATLVLQRFFPYPFLFLFFASVMAGAWFGGTGPG
ncbi:MAG: hypothetical protein ACRD4Y_02750, partial [Candidatus Acidiferrales bacterium]